MQTHDMAAGEAGRIAAQQEPLKPGSTGGDLGPKQLQWCRENIPNFTHCAAAVDARDESARVSNARARAA